MSTVSQRLPSGSAAAAVIAGGLLLVGMVALFAGETVFSAGEGLLEGVFSVFETVTGTRSFLFIGGALGLGVSVYMASESDEAGVLWPLLALASVASMGWVVVSDPSGFLANAREFWWLPVVVTVAWVAYVFVSERGDAGSGSTAIRSTQRRVSDRAGEGAEAFFGILVGVLGVATSIAFAVIIGLQQFGDVLGAFLSEAAYLFVVFLGYVGLGGSVPGAGLIPSLTPAQWVAITLIIGGLAIALRD